MDIIRYNAPRKLLAVARGHPYARDAFCGLLAGLEEFDACLVEQPAAQALLQPSAAGEFDAIVCYDMPGVDFTADDAPAPLAPPEDVRRDYLAMLEAGVGMVFMHHALAAWPGWPEYAEIVGGRFHYRPAELRGETWPDLGCRHAVTHRLSAAGSHPVTQGLPAQFEMTDELYLCAVFEEDVTPLLRSDYGFTQDNFYSAAHAVAGRMHSRAGWSHPPGSNLVGWAKHHRNSPIVYLQGGDDAAAMDNEYFRQLLHNAVRWVSSAAAHDWARAANRRGNGR